MSHPEYSPPPFSAKPSEPEMSGLSYEQPAATSEQNAAIISEQNAAARREEQRLADIREQNAECNRVCAKIGIAFATALFAIAVLGVIVSGSKVIADSLAGKTITDSTDYVLLIMALFSVIFTGKLLFFSKDKEEATSEGYSPV